MKFFSLSNSKKAIPLITTNLKHPGLLNQLMEVEDYIISVWSFGHIDASKLTLIQFPGWPYSGYSMWPLAHELKDTVQFLAFDVPGFVGYSKANEAKYSIKSIANIFAQTIHLLGLKNFGLLGYSAGGPFALQTYYALKNTLNNKNIFSRIIAPHASARFLVFMAPAFNGENISYIRNPEATKKLFYSVKGSAKIHNLVTRIIKTAFGKNLLEYLVMRRDPNLKEMNDIITLLRNELFVQLNNIEADALMNVGEELLTSNWNSSLKDITIPTLYITGNKDTSISADDTILSASMTPGSELDIIEDGPHLIGITHLKQVAEIIRGFLKRKKLR